EYPQRICLERGRERNIEGMRSVSDKLTFRNSRTPMKPTLLLPCIVTLFLTAIMRGDPLQRPGYISGDFIYETAPIPECHASTIVETSDGLVAAWFGGTREKNADVTIWVS